MNICWSHRRHKFLRWIFGVLAILMLLSNSISAAAADVLYFYDDAGRLARTITGSQVIDFQYDEVGNLKGTVTGSNDTQPPTLTAIDPSIMFPGASFAVTFSGTVQEYD